MPNIDWDDILDSAQAATNEKFKNKMSSMVSLTDDNIEKLLSEGISHSDLTEVFKQVKDATKSNTDKANAIKNINKGVEVLVSLATKFL